METIRLSAPVQPPSVEIRYPFMYGDRPADREYVWPIAASAWQEALELIDNEPSLGGIACVEASTRTINRLVWMDGYDFGSEERRGALVRLCRLLCPPPIAKKVILGGILAHNGSWG